MSRPFFIAVLLLSLLAGATPAGAQTQRSAGGESQRIMQQYQQVSAEKAALQAQIAQMKKDLDGAKTELAEAKKERDALKARAAGSSAVAAQQVAQANASKEAVEKSLELNKQRTAELVDRFKETIGALKGVESDRDQLRRNFDELNVKYDKCAQNNEQLYQIGSTVLDRYDHVGFFTKVAAAEPFTRITRTRMDNLVVETHAHAEELRLKKAAPPAPTQPSPPAPAEPSTRLQPSPPSTSSVVATPPARPGL
jgi:chromosome segregation ATPase